METISTAAVIATPAARTAAAEGTSRELIGLAGEYVVATELCRKGLYAQLTLGNRKKVDLLVDGSGLVVARIEVKTKQRDDWPGVKGLSPREINKFLVLVDFQGKRFGERADFYVLDAEDWRRLIRETLSARVEKWRLTIDDDNIVRAPIGPTGKGYVGMGLRMRDVEEFKESWSKIVNAVQPVVTIIPTSKANPTVPSH